MHLYITYFGRKLRGNEGKVPPPTEFGVGDTNANCPPLRFCHVSTFQAPDCSKHQHIGTIRSVLWPSKYSKMRFRLGPAEGTPSPNPPSVLAMRPPEF